MLLYVEISRTQEPICLIENVKIKNISVRIWYQLSTWIPVDASWMLSHHFNWPNAPVKCDPKLQGISWTPHPRYTLWRKLCDEERKENAILRFSPPVLESHTFAHSYPCQKSYNGRTFAPLPKSPPTCLSADLELQHITNDARRNLLPLALGAMPSQTHDLSTNPFLSRHLCR